MRLTILYVLGMLVSITSASAGQNCEIRKDADPRLLATHEQGPYKFDHLSYLWDDPSAFWEFGRCVYNHKGEPLWIDWKSFGLRTTIKADDRAMTSYPARVDDKVVKTSEFFYGPRPERIEPDGVYRPTEAAALPRPERQWLAQFQQGNLASALETPEAFLQELGALKEKTGFEEFFLVAYAEVALPRSEAAFSMLREGKEGLSSEFFSVKLSVGQRFTVRDNGEPGVRTFLRIRTPDEDLPLQVDAEPVKLEVIDEVSALRNALPNFEGRLLLDDFHLAPEGQFYFESELQQLIFPVNLSDTQLTFQFQNYAEVRLETLLALPPS